MKKVDVCIIGAGIAGLTAAIYLKRANINFVILEGNMPGGKLNTIGEIENYPGLNKINGPDFAMELMKQIEDLKIDIEYANVQSVSQNENQFLINSDYENYLAKVAIIATGTIVSKVGIKGEKEFLGKGVSYCATCDGAFYKNKYVAVYGNNEAAIEETLYLLNIVNKVYLIINDDHIEASESLIARLNDYQNLEIIYQSSLKEILGEDKVTSLNIVSNNTLRMIKVDGVFPLVGFKTSNQFLSSLNVLNKNGYLIVDDSKMTSLPGLFAVGDVIDKKVRQLVTAASDGAIVSSAVKKYLLSFNE